jgi:hypothetical protein
MILYVDVYKQIMMFGREINSLLIVHLCWMFEFSNNL